MTRTPLVPKGVSHVGEMQTIERKKILLHLSSVGAMKEKMIRYFRG